MSCPYCSEPVFCDRQALVHIDDGVDPETVPLKTIPYKTTKIELLCVGNIGRGYIHAQVGVQCYEPQSDDVGKILALDGKWLPIRNVYRKERVNYCSFEVPEGFLCWYHRHSQTKPNLEERKCFYCKDGEFVDLGEVSGGLTMKLVSWFYPQYKNYDVRITS